MRCVTEKIFLATDRGPLRLLILRPRRMPSSAPGVLWIHGGGYVVGMPEMAYFSRARALAEKFGAVVVSPAYTLAGRAPYPAALLDCHQALLYLKENAAQLGVRRDQLMVGGESAGGGLAAALCMYEHDRGEISIAFQMPLYPMLDHRDTATSRDNHAPVWNTRRNHKAWACYLRGLTDQPIPAYASPALRTNNTGLPPAYTFICTAEPFYAETLAYVEALRRAGVSAAVDVYSGLFHAFDMLLPFLRVSRQAAAAFEQHFSDAAAHCFAPQPEDAH